MIIIVAQPSVACGVIVFRDKPHQDALYNAADGTFLDRRLRAAVRMLHSCATCSSTAC
jgi:hypothetical protein